MDQDMKRTLGNYRLGRLLGQGGFADVYFGEHIYLKTPAAIKVLHIALNAETLANFLLEARTIAHLEHPHIVRVLEFGIEENTPYLVMNYAPHGSLRQKHSRGQVLPLAVVVHYVGQIAEALQYAHDHLLVHRDIKPENVLLGRTDELMLSDFGLAIVSQSGHQWNRRGEAGTTTYMAPEQLRGEPCYASDQYSLGIMVYEWLCGKTPFVGTGREIAVQHQHMLPPALSTRIPDLPLAVEHVVMKALAKDPRKRYPDIAQFAAALQRAYEKHAPPASPGAATHRLEDVSHAIPDSEVGLLSEVLPIKNDQALARPQAQGDPATSSGRHTSTSGQRGINSDEELVPPGKRPESTPDFDLPPLYSLDIFPTMPPDAKSDQQMVLPQHLAMLAHKPASPLMAEGNRAKMTRRAGLVVLFCAVLVGVFALGYSQMPRTGQSAQSNATGVLSTSGATRVSGTPGLTMPASGPTIVAYSPGGNGTQQADAPTATAAASQAPTVGVSPTTAASPTATATPTATVTATPQPSATSTATATLTVTITSIPTQAKKNSFIDVQVHTSTPGISVQIAVNYSPADTTTTYTAQVTDASGNATISIRLHFGANASATVTAIATLANQQVMSEAHQIQVV